MSTRDTWSVRRGFGHCIAAPPLIATVIQAIAEAGDWKSPAWISGGSCGLVTNVPSLIECTPSRAIIPSPMETDLRERIGRVEETRRRVLDELANVTESQGAFKPSPASWSIQEAAEHLVLAEEVGILFIWRATLSPWDGEHPHKGLSIEAVVRKTWKEKEIAPEPATPRFGGPLVYWIERLRGCETSLSRLSERLEGVDLETVIYPHVLSGPLDAGQRIDFLAFHMERHLDQIRAVIAHADYPAF